MIQGQKGHKAFRGHEVSKVTLESKVRLVSRESQALVVRRAIRETLVKMVAQSPSPELSRLSKTFLSRGTSVRGISLIAMVIFISGVVSDGLTSVRFVGLRETLDLREPPEKEGQKAIKVIEVRLDYPARKEMSGQQGLEGLRESVGLLVRLDSKVNRVFPESREYRVSVA